MVVFDVGSIKLFNELDSDGTERYILNIFTFTSQFSKRIGEIGENWKADFEIELFSFENDEIVKLEGLIKTISNEFDIVNVIYSTSSMGSYLKAVRDQCINISNQLKDEFSQFNFNFVDVFYKDHVYYP